MWESNILIGQRMRYGRGVRGSLEEHKHSGLAQGQEKRGESDIFIISRAQYEFYLMNLIIHEQLTTTKCNYERALTKESL